MTRIGKDTLADLVFQLNWESACAHHSDTYAGQSVNLWRDMLPRQLYDRLLGKSQGESLQLSLSPQDLLEAGFEDVRTISQNQFDARHPGLPVLQPKSGRFYPKGLLKDIPGIFSANITPFRCLGTCNGSINIDLGHPLSARAIDLKVTVGVLSEKAYERGGTMRDWGQIITEGVGMQARWMNKPTDFSGELSHSRLDASPDDRFYDHPRMVQHIDDSAAKILRQFHARLVRPEMAVLDLMSSWQTHLPKDLKPARLTGLGMNEIELKCNEALSDYVVHDLNRTPVIPLESDSFDVVLCSLSIEYLIDPLAVFSQVARILKPGGCFAVTFSNRWFEPKTIRLWTELHEFERTGLALEYFLHGNFFENLHTLSVRGLPRPEIDKYFGKLPYSDPVYAVWGYLKEG